MATEVKVALVTGASSGLGAQIAARLARTGYRVYGTSRRAAPQDAPFEALHMDVDDDASVDAAVATLIAREGRLDVVVSNAGRGIAGPLEDTSTADALAQFQTNFFGTHRVCRATLPHLRARARSDLIVVGSLAGRVAVPYQGMYSASKFALEGYCEALRMELHGSGVRLCLLEPGDFATGFTAARDAPHVVGGLHARRFAAAMAVIERDESQGCDPALAAAAVCRLLASSKLPLRRRVGAWLQTTLVGLQPVLPARWMEGLVASHYGC